jgi:hypothetical protein
MTKAAELAKMGEVLTNSQIGGRRNIIINGGMNVAQRSTSVTGIGASSGYFTCDRWKITTGNSAGRLTMTQTADGPNGISANCLKLDCTTADTSIAAGELLVLQNNIEGQDLQGIGKGVTGAKEVTLSFYVKANAAFNFVAEIKDVDNNRTNGRVFATTTDWVRHEITFQADVDDGSSPFDDDNALSLTLNFWLHAGSTYTGGTLASNWENGTEANRAAGIDSFYSSTDNNFFLTGVQLEVGSQATPFEHRSFGEELALCQRYYATSTGDFGTGMQQAGATYASNGTVAKGNANTVFPVSMRATPSVDFTIASGAATDVTFVAYGLKNAILNMTTQASVNYHYTADAEL